MKRLTVSVLQLVTLSLALILPAAAAPTLPGRIVVVSNIGDKRALLNVDPNSGMLTTLTRPSRQEDGPCISPDGQTLIFAAFSPSAPNWQTWSLDLVSGSQHVLVGKDSWPVCWLPDGRFVGILDCALWTFDRSGHPLKRIADPGGKPIFGAATPQGELIYADLGEPCHIRALNIETGAVRKLGLGADPTVSRDGRYVIFLQDTAYFRMSIAGGRRERLSSLPATANNLRYAPDGAYIVWSVGKGKATRLVIATPDMRQLKTIPIGHDINTITWGP